MSQELERAYSALPEQDKIRMRNYATSQDKEVLRPNWLRDLQHAGWMSNSQRVLLVDLVLRMAQHQEARDWVLKQPIRQKGGQAAAGTPDKYLMKFAVTGLSNYPAYTRKSSAQDLEAGAVLTFHGESAKVLVMHAGEAVGWVPADKRDEFVQLRGPIHGAVINHIRTDAALQQQLYIGVLPGMLPDLRHLVLQSAKEVELRFSGEKIAQEDVTFGADASYTTQGWGKAFAVPFNEPKILTHKGNTMNALNKAFAANKAAATTAATLEAGRIANNQITKLAAKKLPMMVRGCVDTPIGKLLVANAAALAAAHLRPGDKVLAAVTEAMTIQAYQEVLQLVDIDGFLDELLAMPELKRAAAKLDTAAPAPAGTSQE